MRMTKTWQAPMRMDRTPLAWAALAICAVLGLMTQTEVRAQAGATWTPIGPTHATIFSLVRDPFDGQTFLAGTYFGGVYRTTDRGASWAHVPGALATASVFAVAFDASTPGVVYAGTYGEGVYKSLDGGLTWAPRNVGLTDLTVQAVAVDPFDGSRVIALTNAGPFLSADGAATWIASTTAVSGQALAFDPNTQGQVFLGSQDDGVYRSQDGGATFLPFNAGMTGMSVLTLSFDQQHGAVLFAGTSDRFAYKLLPGATVWTDITGSLPQAPVHAMVTLPGNADVVYLASGEGTFLSPDQGVNWYRSLARPSRVLATDEYGFATLAGTLDDGLFATIDMGASWFETGAGLQNVFVGAMTAVASAGQTRLYVATEHGVSAGSGDPAGWSQSAESPGLVQDLVASPADPDVLYASTERDGIWKTTDGGLTWMRASNGLVPAKILSLSSSPAAPHRVFAGTTSGLFVSTDDGATWRTGTTQAMPWVFSVAVDPIRGDVGYFGTLDGRVYRTVDGARSFFPAHSGITTTAPLTTIRITPQFVDVIYAISAAGELFVTQDGGGGWFRGATSIAEPILSVDMDAVAPWIVYLGTAGGGVYKSVSGGVDWASTSPPWYVFSLVVDPADGARVYAGTSAGVRRSTDGGVTWSDAGTGLPDGAVTAVHRSHADGHTLFASVESHGLFKSVDAGGSWTAVTSLPPTVVMPVIETSGASAVLLAGTDLEGIFASADHGATWTPRSVGLSVFTRGLAIDPQAPETLYASGVLGGIYKSVDGGATWHNLGLNDTYVMKVAVDPLHSSTLYAATSAGVKRSRDGGATWTLTGQQASFVFGLITDPRDRHVVYAAAEAGGVFRSDDEGRSWARMSEGLPATNIVALALDPVSGDLLAAAEGAGIWRRPAGATAWTPTGHGGAMFVHAFAPHPAAPGTIYAAAGVAGVYRTTDGGEVWTPVANGLGGELVVAVAADPSGAGVLYAGTSAQAGATARPLFKTVDGGGTWQPAHAGIEASAVQAIGVDPTSPSTLYAATTAGMFKSTDAALTWAPAGAATPTDVRAIHVDDTDGTIVLVASAQHGIMRSVDGGQTWTTVAPATVGGAVFATGAGEGRVHLGTLGTGIFRSEDAGLSWSGGVQPQWIRPFVLAIAVHPTTPSTLYAATGGLGVLLSTNGGDDWQPAGTGLEDAGYIMCLAIDPVAPDTVYAGTVKKGVYVTRDGGDTWTSLASGIADLTVTSLTIDPLDHSIVYAGTEGRGTFRLSGNLP